MTRIFLVRHAEAEGNIYRRAHGHFDGQITGRGNLQIEQLGKRFENEKISAVYASDMSRTRKTALAIYGPHGLTLNTDVRLREVNVGEWEDVSWGDIGYLAPEQHEFFSSDPARWHVDGSEDFGHVRSRMNECISEIAKRHDGETVAVLSHGFAIRAFLSGILGIPSHEIAKVPYCDNTAVALLLFDNDEFKIEYHGDNSHLHAENSTFAHQSWWREDRDWRHENLRYMPFNGSRDRRVLELCRDEVATEFMADAVFTAFVGDEAIGFLGLDTERCDENAGWIYHIYIVPDHRRKSFGVQLLGQAISVYRRLGRDKVYIEAAEVGPAMDFCTKYGFMKTVGLPNGAYIMEKDI